MTKGQNSLYWREWAAARKVDPSLDRHELHIRALGRDKSHVKFSNLDLDKVLAEFRAISNPGSLDAQLRQLNQQKTRLVWKIQMEQLKLLAVCLHSPLRSDPPNVNDQLHAERYILQIIRDQFIAPTFNLREALEFLKADQLENLRSTLAARINDLRKECGITIHEMTTLAGLRCDCAQCAKRRRSESRLQPVNTPF